MSKFRLPKPISTASNEDYIQYLQQFDPTGDRRVLSEEILRLRSLVTDLGGNPVEEKVPALLKLLVSTRKDPTSSSDDALI